MCLLHLLQRVRIAWDFALFCKLIHPFQALICTSCSSGRDFAASFLQIRSHLRHPCSWLTLPTTECVRDFHPRVTAHAGRTKKGKQLVLVPPQNGVSDPQTLNVLRHSNSSLCLTNNKQNYEKKIMFFYKQEKTSSTLNYENILYYYYSFH